MLGYISLTVFVYVFRILIPNFFLFQGDFVPELLLTVIKILILALCVFSKDKSLLLFNCLLGGLLFVFSIAYLADLIPNIFLYFDQSKTFIQFLLLS